MYTKHTSVNQVKLPCVIFILSIKLNYRNGAKRNINLVLKARLFKERVFNLQLT